MPLDFFRFDVIW